MTHFGATARIPAVPAIPGNLASLSPSRPHALVQTVGVANLVLGIWSLAPLLSLLWSAVEFRSPEASRLARLSMLFHLGSATADGLGGFCLIAAGLLLLLRSPAGWWLSVAWLVFRVVCVFLILAVQVVVIMPQAAQDPAEAQRLGITAHGPFLNVPLQLLYPAALWGLLFHSQLKALRSGPPA